MRREDLEILSEWFAGYCRSFYTGDAEHDLNIRLKEEHSQRVRENSALLAASPELTGVDPVLIEAAGLLHDAGRFEQYRRYRTFRDADSVSHGWLGARVLHEERVLGNLSPLERKGLLSAVALHNVFHVPETLPPLQRLLTNVVRDADKLDIWRVFIDYFALPEEGRASAALLGFPDTGRCSPAVLEAVRGQRLVSLSEVRSVDDFRLLQLSWVFDLNFPASSALFLERGIAEKYAAHLPALPEVASALDAVTARAASGAAAARGI